MDIIYDVILKRHNHDPRPDVCVFYDDDREVAIKKRRNTSGRMDLPLPKKMGSFRLLTLF